jgi:hypothetical protein
MLNLRAHSGSYEVYLHVIRRKSTDDSAEQIASIFRVAEEVKKGIKIKQAARK